MVRAIVGRAIVGRPAIEGAISIGEEVSLPISASHDAVTLADWSLACPFCWSGHPVSLITGSFRRRFIRSVTPSVSSLLAGFTGRQLLSRQSVSLMTDAYTHRPSTFLVDEPIICQDAGEERFSLHHLEDASTRSSFLPLGSSLASLGTQPAGPTYFSHTES